MGFSSAPRWRANIRNVRMGSAIRRRRRMPVDACRRHDRCPFPGEDVGASRFKGSCAKT